MTEEIQFESVAIKPKPKPKKEEYVVIHSRKVTGPDRKLYSKGKVIVAYKKDMAKLLEKNYVKKV